MDHQQVNLIDNGDLTAGTLRINGQTTTGISIALSIDGGVTVKQIQIFTLIQSNISSNDEDIYLDINANELGALTVNLSHEVYLLSLAWK